MQWQDTYINSSAVHLGSRAEDIAEAVADGRYDPEEAKLDGYVQVRVTKDESPADMAVAAGKLAVERADVSLDDFAILIHGSAGHQGLYYWPTASYIQQQTIGGTANALEVKQASNSGMAALELAAAYLQLQQTPAAALVTTADEYKLPIFDRYRSDKGQVRGDGGTALVLSRGPQAGVAKLLSTTSIGHSKHERLYRGNRSWEARPGTEEPLDLRLRTKEYLQSGVRIEEIYFTVASNQQKVIDIALEEAGVKLEDVSRFIFSNAGLTIANWGMRKTFFGIDVVKSTWDWGRRIGHMGGGDQAGGLTYLLESHAVHPGDHVVLSGIGAGFTFSCAVLEILRVPDWSTSAL